MQKLIKTIITAVIFTLISGCAYLHPYVPDVQQGNLIKPAKVQQLKVGMAEAQVDAIMGTPLLANTFSNNHWNYVYTIHNWGQKTHHQRLIVTFKDGRVTKIE